MAELIQSGAVFLHVPKCAGTWVREALREQKLLRGRVGYKHSAAGHIDDIMRHHGWQFIRHWPLRPTVLPGTLRRAFKFCFVRHPVRWYESWWKFMVGRWHSPEPGRWHPQRVIERCADDDFNRFVLNVLDSRPGYVSEMFRWYTDGSAFVGKCEHIADDLVRALRRIGVRFDEERLRGFPAMNVSPSRRANPQWDPEVLERAIEAEVEGIERYGYEDDVQRMCDEVCARRSSQQARPSSALAKGVA